MISAYERSWQWQRAIDLLEESHADCLGVAAFNAAISSCEASANCLSDLKLRKRRGCGKQQ